MATSDSPLNVPDVTLAVARGAAPTLNIPAFYVPETLKFISWDAPRLAHTGVDIDYKMTAYDWYDRELVWSVNGPTGMTIDADGTLHWTPSTDQVSETVTVECSLGGQETLSKTFTCTVDNSRCFFVDPAGSDANPGTLAEPFLTFEQAAIAVKGATSARTIYSRAGTYTVSWDWLNNSNFSDVYNKSWTENEPLLLRNYPGEEVKYQTTSGHGFRMSGKRMVVYGMWFSGATTTEVAGCLLDGPNVAKRMRVSDSDWSTTGNCTGFKYQGGGLLDQCQAWNNYDRSDLDNNNNSDYLGYAYSGSNGPSYVIDCLSGGVDGEQTRAGFKLKHAGANTPHWHKCVAINDSEAFTAVCDKMTVRHCAFVSTSGKALSSGLTDPSSGGVNATNQGFLVENCKAVALGVEGISFDLSPWTEAVITETPPLYANNDFVTYGTATGNIFSHGKWSNSGADPAWQVGFKSNNVFTEAPTTSVRVNGAAFDLTKLTGMGSGNNLLDSAPDYTFSAAGRTFELIDGSISETTSNPPPTLLYDGFESADMSAPDGPAPAKNTSGFTWGGNNKTSVVTMDPAPLEVYQNGVINDYDTDTSKDWTAKTGNYCLMFRYDAADSGVDEPEWTEQRFNLGGSYPEVWVKYWIRVPFNFEHGSTVSPNNHKFFVLYMDAYSGNGDGATLFWNMWGDSDGSNSISIARNEGGQQPSGGQSQHTPFIQVPEDRGRWMEIVIQAVASSANTTSDGEARLWRRWEDESSFTMLHEYNGVLLQTPDTGDASNGWHQGYVMGWANAPYAAETEWLMDDFQVSEASLLEE